jgi:hypothetical protein
MLFSPAIKAIAFPNNRVVEKCVPNEGISESTSFYPTAALNLISYGDGRRIEFNSEWVSKVSLLTTHTWRRSLTFPPVMELAALAQCFG